MKERGCWHPQTYHQRGGGDREREREQKKTTKSKKSKDRDKEKGRVRKRERERCVSVCARVLMFRHDVNHSSNELEVVGGLLFWFGGEGSLDGTFPPPLFFDGEGGLFFFLFVYFCDFWRA